MLRNYLWRLIALIILFLPASSLFPQDNNKNEFITLAAVGDIMMGTSFPDRSYLPPGDNPYPLMSSVFDILSAADLTFGNLEGPFSDSAKLEKKCRDTTTCYAFRMPEKYSGVLDSAGFDLISIANNHIGDFGYEAKETTVSILDSLGIIYAGTEDYPWSVKMTNDSILIGFCAFAPNKGTINLHDDERVDEIMSILSDSCDIIIASVHGGGEGADYQNVKREEEFYYGENRGNMYEFAHKLIDRGADIVLGHGPHVSRAMEIYRGRLIAYSLGNFCTYRRFNLRGPNGYSPVLIAELGKDGAFRGGRIIPVYQNNYGYVKHDPRKRAIFKIRELTETDFPESGISIDNDGNIKLMPGHGR
ncbi:MAG: CapA family protein [Bacteroidales bacterium]|nr:CapA family protein [Bacteroidales bacterium]